jgi:phosphoribosylaminoimidazolecarboxamide formyltransferase / IMP cyclohydrolase
MSNTDKTIKTALVSVFSKHSIDTIARKLAELGIKIVSTGGTHAFIESLGLEVTSVESLTGYPSIMGGRVKTLHPKVFGGILGRKENVKDQEEMKQYEISSIDLVIVDLYPFEETVIDGASEDEIIEKIDIGGISLIRAAAKNFEDTLVIPSRDYYPELIDLLNNKGGVTNIEDRKKLAAEAFNVSSNYDSLIYKYFTRADDKSAFKQSIEKVEILRYGENPHQKGIFYGNLDDMFDKLWGKEISYNNLLDIDAAVSLLAEFDEPTFAILKHNNACGLATRDILLEAWKDALAGDPVSAYGGVIITNGNLTIEVATEINKIFFEIIIAPSYDYDALELIKQKKNRIILLLKNSILQDFQFRTVLNGVLAQSRDNKIERKGDLDTRTIRIPSQQEETDMIFANILVKHSKSNTIVLAKNKQLIASGVGQTSRVDALKQAITKAANFGFDLKGSVMASDAFFPFADCVEIAHEAGITAVIQPGGSIHDKDSIEYCNKHKMAMVFTGVRHFKH